MEEEALIHGESRGLIEAGSVDRVRQERHTRLIHGESRGLIEAQGGGRSSCRPSRLIHGEKPWPH